MKQAFGLVKQVAQAVVEDAGSLLSQSKVLRDYKLGTPVATCGPGEPGIWAIYSGVCKKPGAVVRDVSIWVLDKRRLVDAHKAIVGSTVLKQVSYRMLKHPGVVKVIEPLEDSAGQMVLVTEAVFGSLHNIMTHFANVPGVESESRETVMSEVEVRSGLVGLADTLGFLHAEAGLAHCGLCPHVVMLTAEGVWKLAGFSFALASDYAVPAGGAGGASGAAAQYTYADAFPPPWDEMSKPLLPYTAPELVGGWGGPGAGHTAITPAADIFSLGALAYELLFGYCPSISGTGSTGGRSGGGGTGSTGGSLTQQYQLLPVRSNLHEYRQRLAVVAAPQGGPLASVPASLQSVLRAMVTPAASSRPSAAAFSSAPYFQEDVLLRSLKFLDTVLQREVAQKLAFSRDLSSFWRQFDDRLLRLRVLPPLIQEMRSESLQPVLLPLVLSMLERVPPKHFASQLLPALVPVLESANGEMLAALVKGSDVLARVMSGDAIVSHLVPLYARALDVGTAPQVQEECLRAVMVMLPGLDYGALRNALMPRVRDACCRTTAASVRVGALSLMAAAAGRLDRADADASLEVAAQVVGVDRSAPTVMGVVTLADALSHAHGHELTAARLLPLLCPLLLCPSLTPRHLRDLHTTITGMLQRVVSKVAPEGGAGKTTAPAATAAAATGGLASWDTPIDAPTSHNHRANNHNSKPPTAATASSTQALEPWTSPTTLTTSHPTTSTTAIATPAWSVQPPTAPTTSYSSSSAGRYGRAPGSLVASSTAAGSSKTTGSSGTNLGGWGSGGATGNGLGLGSATAHAPSATAAVPPATATSSGGDLFGGLSVAGVAGGGTNRPLDQLPTTSPSNSSGWGLGSSLPSLAAHTNGPKPTGVSPTGGALDPGLFSSPTLPHTAPSAFPAPHQFGSSSQQQQQQQQQRLVNGVGMGGGLGTAGSMGMSGGMGVGPAGISAGMGHGSSGPSSGGMHHAMRAGSGVQGPGGGGGPPDPFTSLTTIAMSLPPAPPPPPPAPSSPGWGGFAGASSTAGSMSHGSSTFGTGSTVPGWNGAGGSGFSSAPKQAVAHVPHLAPPPSASTQVMGGSRPAASPSVDLLL